MKYSITGIDDLLLYSACSPLPLIFANNVYNQNELTSIYGGAVMG